MFNPKIYLILILFCNLLLAKEGFNPYQEYNWGAKSTPKEFADPIYWIYDFVYLNAYIKSLNTPTKEQIAKILNSIQNQTMEQILLIYPKSSSFVYPNSIIHSCIILGAKHDMESKKQSILCSTKYWLKLTQDFLDAVEDSPQDICRIYDEIFVDDEDDSEIESTLFGEGSDPLYDKALEIVIQAGKASASYIQRRLKIGYNRAARLVEEMEDRGIVGPANGSKPREIIHMP